MLIGHQCFNFRRFCGNASFLGLLFFFSAPSHGLISEWSVQGELGQTIYNENNDETFHSYRASVSFFFWSRVALELSRSHFETNRRELIQSIERTTQQTAEGTGLDLLIVLAGRSAFFQPYIKGGAAYVEKTYRVNVNDLDIEILTPATLTPSYGLGVRLAFTQTFQLRISYSAWVATVENERLSQDTRTRIGLTWVW